MLLGDVGRDETRVLVDMKLHCTQCSKEVRGNVYTSQRLHGTAEFDRQSKEFQKVYLCGRCRDRKRVAERSATAGQSLTPKTRR